MSWIYEWVEGIYKGVFQKVLTVWHLRTEDTWTSYKAMDIQGLHEQQLLIDARKELLARWNETYPYRKKPEDNFDFKKESGNVQS